MPFIGQKFIEIINKCNLFLQKFISKIINKIFCPKILYTNAYTKKVIHKIFNTKSCLKSLSIEFFNELLQENF